MLSPRHSRYTLSLIEQEWLQHAACAGADTDMFFPEGQQESRHMLKQAQLLYCKGCPVRAECYAYGVRSGAVGIWGGVLIPLRTRPEKVDEDRPVPDVEERENVIPYRIREPDEEPGWMRRLFRGRRRR